MKAPNEYFSLALEQIKTQSCIVGTIKDEDDFWRNLEANAIPSDILNHTYQNYNEFLEERRKLMADKIRKYYEKL